MDDKNYFSWQNFNELANLDDHISFISVLIDKYQWEESTRLDLREQLQRILNKQKDQQLNLSIIGEFSTGKSSFINALLRHNLLTASIMQGTTQASTLIQQGNGYVANTKYLDGHREEYYLDSIEELREHLKVRTTDPTICPTVKQVIVSLPSANLAGGVRIIDTPGTNALEIWHEDVTRRAIRELSDLSVILVDATKPLPVTLNNFVHENLSDMVQQCVFVVTKLDLVPAREREPLLRNIRMRLKAEFDIPDPMVLPYVSIFVFEQIEDVTIDPDLLEQSLQSEQKLFTHLAEQRLKAQAMKLVMLTDHLLDQLGEQMSAIQACYEEELALLQKLQQTDLEPFILEQTVKRQRQFGFDINSARQQLSNRLYGFTDSTMFIIDRQLNNTFDLSQAQNYVEIGLMMDCNQQSREMVNATTATCTDMRQMLVNQMQGFQQDFEALFPELEILSIRPSMNTDHYPHNVPINTQNIASVTEFIKETALNEKKSKWSNIATTFFLPGITLITSFIPGGGWGRKKGPAIEQVRSELKERLRLPVGNYINSNAEICLSSFDKYAALMLQNVATEIERYLKEYKETVDERIRQQNELKQAIRQKLAVLDTDRTAILTRKHMLASIGAAVWNEVEP